MNGFFFGMTYAYPTPNNGICEIGVCPADRTWVVAWMGSNNRMNKVKTPHLPCHHSPEMLQGMLDAWAGKRGLDPVLATNIHETTCVVAAKPEANLPLAAPSLQDIIETANHHPNLADEIALVMILERLLAALNALKAKFPRSEHVQAAGHLRSALSVERQLLAEYQERDGLITGAIQANAGREVKEIAP